MTHASIATTQPRHLHLVDRLRGKYHIPVNDGAGPLNGSMTFSREFPTPPIQKEAADLIEQLLAAIKNSDDAHWTPAMRAAMAKAEGR